MRSKNRNMLVALVAVFALGAVGVSSAAAALPEFVHGAGEAFPVSFASQSMEGSEEVRLETHQLGTFLECGHVTISGQITGAKSANVTANLGECGEWNKGCETAKAKAGNVTITGTGALAYLSKSSKTVGVVLSIAETKVLCGEPENRQTLIVKGNVILPITSINTKTTAYQATLHQTSPGTQEVTQYENEKGEAVKAKLTASAEGSLFYEASLNITRVVELTMAKAITISA